MLNKTMNTPFLKKIKHEVNRCFCFLTTFYLFVIRKSN